MTDPRNIAHDKKVQQEKKHHGEKLSPDADEKPQPGKKPHHKHHSSDLPPESVDELDPASKTP
jgi:hypothetical protein